MKKCKTCGLEKPEAEFARQKSTKDGLTIYCKACISVQNKQYQAARRAKLKPENGLSRCSVCLEYKPTTDFALYFNGRPKSKCKSCDSKPPVRVVTKVAENWKDGGASIYEAIVDYLHVKGFAVSRLPDGFPYSTRAIHDIKNGVWSGETLAKLPFDTHLSIQFRFNIPEKPKLPVLDKDALAILREWLDGASVEEICTRHKLDEAQWGEYLQAFLAHGFKRRAKKAE